MIASRDIAAAAATALRERDFTGFVIREVLGPRDLTMTEVTRTLGAVLGKPDLSYVRFSDDDMTDALVSGGFSPEMAAQFVEMTRAFNSGAIQTQAGRQTATTTPTTFEDYARAARDRILIDLNPSPASAATESKNRSNQSQELS